MSAELTNSSGARHVAAACALIAGGGLALGLQVDGNGALVGTGYTTLAIGAVIASVVALVRATRSNALPRDVFSFAALAFQFAGTAFLASGVLAPGGAWMFFGVVLVIAALARSSEPGRGALALFAALFIFRAWVTYQGSQHRWQVMSLEVPLLSSLPFDFLEPIQRVELGEFTPRELGFPPAGIAFAPTLALWSCGFAALVAGLAWLARAAPEHENDRVQSTLDELPPELAQFVARILPEDEWRALGLHGLSRRLLQKKLEQLVAQRIAARRELENAWKQARLPLGRDAGGFAGEIYGALAQLNPPREHKP